MIIKNSFQESIALLFINFLNLSFFLILKLSSKLSFLECFLTNLYICTTYVQICLEQLQMNLLDLLNVLFKTIKKNN